ncbi:putative choline transporter Hnm1 [Aspergillus homomorphus CBS 101889]|uniref:Amino acid transporter n=1 Tax=Aspergillus homomorphus (strain CBS 101889) TaxID=1450537 RepID=A0A395I046_ASPHC|nr:hypothetical protein BO97DRAFT_469579 [Aspergillus homomorphus CBS 101889]RAL13571.1 hypothetical protein BO97DRAFT_469579 [Aspergillus homomorphus CBS 101889]
MGDTKAPSAPAMAQPYGDYGSVQDADELRLAQMGHKQELKRHFSSWSLIGLAANCTISWAGLGLGLITSINAGGPGALIRGFILVFILQCFLATSLAEVVSAYPTDFVLQPWMTFVTSQGFNLVTCAIVMFGNRWIPAINKFSLCYLQLAWLVILVTVAAAAPKHNDAEFVFETWINETGWTNNVICFITGLVNPLYSLGGLDGITHITEEMPNPERDAPLALACTLSIAFVTGSSYLLALMFSVQDYTSLADSPTGLPLAEIFRLATQSRGRAFALVFLLWVAVGPCVIGSQLSTGRMLWAFARDGGLPSSGFCSKVNPRYAVPVKAQLCVGIIIALLGCIYLGSSTAFNLMMNSAIMTINNLAYLMPILTNLCHGMAVNIVTVAWFIFAILFFSFPYEMPVTVSNMNYTCVCVGGFLSLELLWWLVAGKKFSKHMQKVERHDGETAHTSVVISAGEKS